MRDAPCLNGKESSLMPTLRLEILGKVFRSQSWYQRTLIFVYAGANCEATTLMLLVYDRWLAELILALSPHPCLLNTIRT